MCLKTILRAHTHTTYTHIFLFVLRNEKNLLREGNKVRISLHWKRQIEKSNLWTRTVPTKNMEVISSAPPPAIAQLNGVRKKDTGNDPKENLWYAHTHHLWPYFDGNLLNFRYENVL